VALATSLLVFLFAYLNLNRWHMHFSYGVLAWVLALGALAGLATFDPSVAAGIARLSFAATAVVGVGLIAYLAYQGYDRAIMLVPSWLMILVWLLGCWMTVTGQIDNDIIQPALSGGLILITLMIGFTVMQHAFAGGALNQGLFSDVERQALALTGSGDTVWDWDVPRDRIVTRPDVSRSSASRKAASRAARNWLPALHPDDRDNFRTTLDVILEHRRGRSCRPSGCAAPTATITGSRCGAAGHRLDGEVVRCVGTMVDRPSRRRARSACCTTPCTTI
jgi:hypothetical protein